MASGGCVKHNHREMELLHQAEREENKSSERGEGGREGGRENTS